MKRLVEDAEPKRLWAMADGSGPFQELARREEVSGLGLRGLRRLDARAPLPRLRRRGPYLHVRQVRVPLPRGA